MTGSVKRWLATLVVGVVVQTAGVVPVAAQETATGVIQGRVTFADSNAQLSGVRVRLIGTPVTGVTDEAGRYLLAGVPAGSVRVEFTYLGFETLVRDATVAGGATLQLDAGLRLPALQETVSVTAQAAAQRDALNLYRASNGIANFISADDIGQFVDQNVAESLQRLPGIAITRDQGEGRFVSVRGMEAGLSSVSINGMRIGTPEDSSRAVPLDVIPVGSADLVQVTKTPTPDMPGDAIGGSVEIRSASAFDRDGRTVTYRIEGSRATMSGDMSPKMQLNYSDVFEVGGVRSLGLSFGINHLDRQFESDNVEVLYMTSDDFGPASLVPEELQQRKYFVNRERFGTNLNLDFRPSVSNQFHFNTVFSRFTDRETRQRNIFVFADGDLASFDGRNGRFEDIEGAAIRRRVRFRTKDQDTLAAAFGGSHLVNRWSLDYEVGHSVTRERVPDETEGRWRYALNPLDATFTVGGGLPSFSIVSGTSADVSHLDNVNHVFDRVVLVPKIVDDDDTSLRANAEYRGAAGMTAFALKTGIDVRLKSKFADVGESELRRGPALALQQFTRESPGFRLGSLGPGIDGPAFLDYYTANSSLFSARPQDVDANTVLNESNDYRADEEVVGSYVMATIGRGAWQLIPGVRLERTSYSATGNELTFDEDGDLSIESRSAASSYTNVLPALHVRYDAGDRMVVRAAWSNTLARPAFGDISPRFTIDNESLEIESGNPALDPYTSSNLDFMVDVYTGSSSVISAGVFRKAIDNYIVDFTSNSDAAFPGYEVTRPVNGTDASAWGIELNLEQDLGTWAGALDGFLVGANVTLLDSRLDVAERPGETFSLPLSAERSGNMYLGYERGNFSGRVSMSGRGAYLSELGDNPNFDIYVNRNIQLDFMASYRLARGLEFVVEGANLTDAPLELYQGTPDTTFQYEIYGRTFAFGLRGRF